MVGETLPTMKAVLEAIAYGCFIFMLPLAMLPFGWQYLMRWAQIILWLQMWAPLYAILNYVMTMAAKGKTMAALSIGSEGGVTIASSLGVTNMNADIQAMAGYLAMSIPFLSIAILKGVGSFVHMSSHLGNITQSAAGAAASEVTSGNLSYGNFSEGNVQMVNTSMLNHSRSASYRTGSFQFQDGRSDITTMADGVQIANIGTSTVPVSVNLSDSLSAQQSEMATQSYQKGWSQSESSAQHLGSAARSAVQLSETLGKTESSHDAASMNYSTEQSQAIHKGANLVKDFAKQNNVSDEKAASILGEASVGIGLGKNSLGMTGKGSLNAQEQALYQKAEKFAEDHNYQQAIRDAAQASQNMSHTLTNESAKRLAEDVSGSFETGMTERREASKSFQESTSYSRQAMLTQTRAATINRNASQEFVEWMAEQPADHGPGQKSGPMGHREAARLIATKPAQAQAYADRFVEEKGLVKHPHGDRSIGMNSEQLQQDYHNDTPHQTYRADETSRNAVQAEAANFQATGKVDASARSHVDLTQDDHKRAIAMQSQEVMQETGQVKQQVAKQHTKGVVRRLGERGVGEVKELGGDIAENFRKILPGEPQQK